MHIGHILKVRLICLDSFYEKKKKLMVNKY